MNLPILLIFYVSKWKNNRKHWKIGIWRHCHVIIRRCKSKLGVGLLCTEMIIVCKFHDPSIIGSRDTEGGPRSPPPVTDWPKKPSLNRVKFGKLSRSFLMFVCPLGEKFPAWASHSWSRPTRSGAVGECKYCLLDASYHMYSWCLYFDA